MTKKVNKIHAELESGTTSEHIEVLITQLRNVNLNLENSNSVILDCMIDDEEDKDDIIAETEGAQQYRDRVTKVEVIANRFIRGETENNPCKSVNCSNIG